MNAWLIAAAIVVVFLFSYMAAALLFPERFE
ncbi:MAG: K(+)-transporting ATPase subunit F [Candidatus Eisenbacteria bacterium]